MRTGGRIAAAIDVLGEIKKQHRPASEALKDWGKSHRFAGSTDRHAIGTLVYDCLRKRNSLSSHMQSDEPRSLVLGALRFLWGKDTDWISAAVMEDHGPGQIGPGERHRLDAALARTGIDWIDGDFPQWLAASFKAVFGMAAADQGIALAARAPVDLRINPLKTDRESVLKVLERFGAQCGPYSPYCVRLPPPEPEVRNANVEAEPAHGLGWFEVQDAASQVAALMSGAQPGETVADICAGAGGKTLALSAMMRNEGRLVAHDADRHRLRPIFERLLRAGASNVDVVAAGDGGKLEAMAKFDCVLIDAPCSGSGAWRRKPDAKWRLSEKQLQQRLKDQKAALEQGAGLVRQGGRLIYVTCSVLPEENAVQVEAFCSSHRDFKVKQFAEQWRETIGGTPPLSADGSTGTLLLTPASHGTDGFFVAVLERS